MEASVELAHISGGPDEPLDPPLGYEFVQIEAAEIILGGSVPGRISWLPAQWLRLYTTKEINRPTFVLVPKDCATSLEVWQREIDPLLTKSLELRLDIWAENTVKRWLADVARYLDSDRVPGPAIPVRSDKTLILTSADETVDNIKDDGGLV